MASLSNPLSAEQSGQLFKYWLEVLLSAYPVEDHEFLLDIHDRYANPVGYTLFTPVEPVVAAFAE